MREREKTVTVSARVSYPSTCSSETMHALPDPADSDQAVIQNVPFFVKGLNFGDVVGLGVADDLGIRRIEAVVTPSGHARFLVLTGPLSITDLDAHLHDIFPSYALRIEGSGDGLLAVSVHPDLDPEDVSYEVILWFEEQGLVPEDEDIGISEPVESQIGPLP